MRVLYLFAGKRRERFTGTPGDDFPDTQFYGMNHLPMLGLETDYKEFYDVMPSHFLENHLNFNMRHALLYFGTRGYDIVFGSALLPMMIFKKLFGSKCKFILLNISLTRLLKKNGTRTIKGKIIRLLLREVDAIICVSRAQREYLVRDEQFSHKKVFVVVQGVDTRYFTPTPERHGSKSVGEWQTVPNEIIKSQGRKSVVWGFTPGKNREEHLVLSVGRDNARDYATIVKVARRLPEYEFVFICSKRNLKGIGTIPTNVTVLYDVTSDELRHAYRRAAVLIMATHDETFLDGADCSGMTVLLEAFACGLPVIVTRRSCHEDYLEDGKNALIVDPYDVQHLTDKVRMILADKLFAEELWRNARESVERDFSTIRMAEALKNVFNRVAVTF